MKKGILLSVAIVMFIFGITGVASALNIIQNGDFGTGDLTYWVGSDVSVIDGQAVLNVDNSSGTASLSQDFYISPATTSLTISFDLTFGGVDTAWMSDDSFDSWIDTFVHCEWWFLEWNDWEREELLDGESNNGLTTYHFSTNFIVPGNLVDVDPNGSIAFSLNETAGWFGDNTDTWLSVDNVVVDDGTGNGTAPVPEPTTLMLLGSGLIGLAGFRKKMKK